jgi:phytoene synthase
MPDPADDQDAQVQRLDPERWLATRLIADANARAIIVALYALNLELARVGETVTQPLAGEIRLAWWRDQIEALVAGGAPPAQPVLKTLAPALQSGALSRSLLDDLIEARHTDLELQPFADEAALVRYIDGTSGALMGLAAHALDPAADPAATRAAARAWGWAALFRALPHYRHKNRSWTPADWGGVKDGEIARRVQDRVKIALKAARTELKPLPVAAFPAVAYATLSPVYARGDRPGALSQRARIVWAAAVGRV